MEIKTATVPSLPRWTEASADPLEVAADLAVRLGADPEAVKAVLTRRATEKGYGARLAAAAIRALVP